MSDAFYILKNANGSYTILINISQADLLVLLQKYGTNIVNDLISLMGTIPPVTPPVS